LTFDGLRAVSWGIATVAPPGKMARVVNRLRIWDVPSGKVLLTVMDREGDYALSPDGKLLGAPGRVGDDPGGPLNFRPGAVGQVTVWRTDTGENVVTLPNVTVPCHLYFGPGGKLLATASFVDNQVVLWDLTTGKILHRLQGHARPVLHVAFSLDGKRAASLAPFAEVKLCDTRTGNELLNLPLEKGAAGNQSLAFSNDGTRLTASKRYYSVGGATPALVNQQSWDATPRSGEGAREGNTPR
jgi:WD40 repeat protein